MLKKDLRKNLVKNLNKEVHEFNDWEISNVLLKEYEKVSYQATVSYQDYDDSILVDGLIDFQLKVIDARDGNEVDHDQQIVWSEQYLLDDFNSEEVDFNQLVAEQININIPINLSHNRDTINKVGPGWQLLSEDEFEHAQLQTSDPRWAKLKEYQQKEK